jgi:alcohol dehydrogenase (NADP+)
MPVHAYAAHASDRPLVPFHFEARAPKAREVQIAITHCGICHSDIHQARNEWQNTVYPVVPGHEIVGKVLACGADVKKFRLNDRVGVGCLINACRTCGSCKVGLENYCETGCTFTYNSPLPEGGRSFGGYSTHITVDEDFVLRVPANLDPAGVAPLLCAGITTYSPLRHVGVKKGDRVGVMGLGGLGHMAVKLAASMGAEVTVLSRTRAKEKDAKRLGASSFALTNDDGAVAKLASHFDYIVDTISAKHDVSTALGWLKRDGTLIMVGASELPLDLAVFPLIMGRRKIMGSLIGGIPETQAMLDHCGKHNITSDIELIQASQINEAFERTLAGDVRYRFVIDCSTLGG